MDLEEMLDQLDQNRPLYKDSGLWQIWDDDMTEVIYQQSCNESLFEFIERVYNDGLTKQQ